MNDTLESYAEHVSQDGSADAPHRAAPHSEAAGILAGLSQSQHDQLAREEQASLPSSSLTHLPVVQVIQTGGVVNGAVGTVATATSPPAAPAAAATADNTTGKKGHYSPAEDEEIVEGRQAASPKTFIDLGKALGRTTESVRGRYNRLSQDGKLPDVEARLRAAGRLAAPSAITSSSALIDASTQRGTDPAVSMLMDGPGGEMAGLRFARIKFWGHPEYEGYKKGDVSSHLPDQPKRECIYRFLVRLRDFAVVEIAKKPRPRYTATSGNCEKGKDMGGFHFQCICEIWVEAGKSDDAAKAQFWRDVNPLLEAVLQDHNGRKTIWPSTCKGSKVIDEKETPAFSKGGYANQVAYTQKERFNWYARVLANLSGRSDGRGLYIGVSPERAAELGTVSILDPEFIQRGELLIEENNLDHRSIGGQKFAKNLLGAFSARGEPVAVLDKPKLPMQLLKIVLTKQLEGLDLDPITIVMVGLTEGHYKIGSCFVMTAHGGNANQIRLGSWLRCSMSVDAQPSRRNLCQIFFGTDSDSDLLHLWSEHRSSFLPSVWQLARMGVRDIYRCAREKGYPIPRHLEYLVRSTNPAAIQIACVDMGGTHYSSPLNFNSDVYSVLSGLTERATSNQPRLSNFSLNPIVLSLPSNATDEDGSMCAFIVDHIFHAKQKGDLNLIEEAGIYGCLPNAASPSQVISQVTGLDASVSPKERIERAVGNKVPPDVKVHICCSLQHVYDTFMNAIDGPERSCVHVFVVATQVMVTPYSEVPMPRPPDGADESAGDGLPPPSPRPPDDISGSPPQPPRPTFSGTTPIDEAAVIQMMASQAYRRYLCLGDGNCFFRGVLLGKRAITPECAETSKADDVIGALGDLRMDAYDKACALIDGDDSTIADLGVGKEELASMRLADDGTGIGVWLVQPKIWSAFMFALSCHLQQPIPVISRQGGPTGPYLRGAYLYGDSRMQPCLKDGKFYPVLDVSIDELVAAGYRYILEFDGRNHYSVWVRETRSNFVRLPAGGGKAPRHHCVPSPGSPGVSPGDSTSHPEHDFQEVVCAVQQQFAPGPRPGGAAGSLVEDEAASDGGSAMSGVDDVGSNFDAGDLEGFIDFLDDEPQEPDPPFHHATVDASIASSSSHAPAPPPPPPAPPPHPPPAQPAQPAQPQKPQQQPPTQPPCVQRAPIAPDSSRGAASTSLPSHGVAVDSIGARSTSHHFVVAFNIHPTAPTSTGHDLKRFQPKEVLVFVGPTGTGKTERAWTMAPDAYPWSPGMASNGGAWFDGYSGETDMIFDEFRGQMDWGFFLALTDKYPVFLPIKGGHVRSRLKRIIITSPLEPEQWYPELAQGDRIDQLHRRITHVERCTKRD